MRLSWNLRWVLMVGMSVLPLLGGAAGRAPATTESSAASISGSIVDDRGAPLAGFSLELVRIESAAAPRAGDIEAPPMDPLAEKVIDTQTTDPAGRFTFENVPPGDYLLRGGSKEEGFVYTDVIVKGNKPVNVGKVAAVKV